MGGGFFLSIFRILGIAIYSGVWYNRAKEGCSTYLKKQKRGNDIYLSIMEKYYVPGVGARERTYEGIGLVS